MTDAVLTLRLRRMAWEAEGVLSLDFVAPDGGDLPRWNPGAHVDLHMPDGMMRQYSLCGDPHDRKHYRIAVREVPGGRVSGAIHRVLRPGALMKVGAPRDNFPLIAAPRYLFIAGGIGITPLLPMMHTAVREGAAGSLYYCVARLDNAPFLDEIMAADFDVSLHVSASGTRLDVATLLAEPPEGTELYCCGPDRLMLAVEEAAAAWPEGSVHFEWFKPRARPEDETSGTFELVCARSGLTLTVPPDQSVLNVLTSAGIDLPRSCEQGICGTCECQIIEGAADHRDSILSAAEQAANQTMMACVSRAKGPRLVLDI